MNRPLKSRVALRVQPNASRSEVSGWRGDTLRIRVTAPPVDDRANFAVADTLAQAVGVRRSAVSIVLGRGSRNKVAEVTGLDDAELRRRLQHPG